MLLDYFFLWMVSQNQFGIVATSDKAVNSCSIIDTQNYFISSSMVQNYLSVLNDVSVFLVSLRDLLISSATLSAVLFSSVFVSDAQSLTARETDSVVNHSLLSDQQNGFVAASDKSVYSSAAADLGFAFTTVSDNP